MRIVLLARHYPPAVSGGAKRPFLLAQALRSAGHDVWVCAPSLPEGEPGFIVPHPNRDPSTKVSAGSHSLRGWLRSWLLWPDPDIRWAMRAARTVLATGPTPDWIISTSPPESIHVAGQWLARQTGARWLADFRDLWLQAPHRKERRHLHRIVGERLVARTILPKASLVLAVDETVAAEAKALGAKAVSVLPHFVQDLSSDADMPALPAEDINIVHVGSVSLSDPEARIGDLLQPFEQARQNNSKLRLHLIGRLTEVELHAVTSSPEAEAITVWGVVSLERAFSFMRAADALAFVASWKMHVPPSKLVDYLMFDKPIIAAGVGPWRDDPRSPKGDTILLLADLRKNSRRNDAVRPLSADDATKLVLGWMRQSEDN